MQSSGNSWRDFLNTFWENPSLFIQQNLIWIVSFLILLFLISRINNRLEITGVNRAIFVTRGIVSTITAFIIAPIAFILLLNLIAFIKGMPLISLVRIGDWIWLTLTSYYWLLQAFFGGGEKQLLIYDTSSIIRILWIVIPTVFIWFRTTDNLFWRVMLIPYVLGIFYITRYQKANPTFIDEHVPQSIRDYYDQKKLILENTDVSIDEIDLNDLNEKGLNTKGKNAPEYKPTTNPNVKNHQKQDTFSGLRELIPPNKIWMITSFLLLFFVLGLVVGFYTQQGLVALFMVLISIIGFVFIYPMLSDDPATVKTPLVVPKDDRAVFTLMKEFEELYEANQGKPSVPLSDLAVLINQKLKAGQIEAPPQFCEKYKSYFFDLCE